MSHDPDPEAPTPEERAAAAQLARLLDGEGPGDTPEALRPLLEAAALLQALDPAGDDDAGLEAVAARLDASLVTRAGGARRAALSLAAVAVLALGLGAVPAARQPALPELPAPPPLRRHLRPSEIHRRFRLRASQLAPLPTPTRRKPWSARSLRQS